MPNEPRRLVDELNNILRSSECHDAQLLRSEIDSEIATGKDEEVSLRFAERELAEVRREQKAILRRRATILQTARELQSEVKYLQQARKTPQIRKIESFTNQPPQVASVGPAGSSATSPLDDLVKDTGLNTEQFGGLSALATRLRGELAAAKSGGRSVVDFDTAAKLGADSNMALVGECRKCHHEVETATEQWLRGQNEMFELARRIDDACSGGCGTSVDWVPSISAYKVRGESLEAHEQKLECQVRARTQQAEVDRQSFIKELEEYQRKCQFRNREMHNERRHRFDVEANAAKDAYKEVRAEFESRVSSEINALEKHAEGMAEKVECKVSFELEEAQASATAARLDHRAVMAQMQEHISQTSATVRVLREELPQFLGDNYWLEAQLASKHAAIVGLQEQGRKILQEVIPRLHAEFSAEENAEYQAEERLCFMRMQEGSQQERWNCELEDCQVNILHASSKSYSSKSAHVFANDCRATATFDLVVDRSPATAVNPRTTEDSLDDLLREVDELEFHPDEPTFQLNQSIGHLLNLASGDVSDAMGPCNNGSGNSRDGRVFYQDLESTPEFRSALGRLGSCKEKLDEIRCAARQRLDVELALACGQNSREKLQRRYSEIEVEIAGLRMERARMMDANNEVRFRRRVFNEVSTIEHRTTKPVNRTRLAASIARVRSQNFQMRREWRGLDTESNI